MKGKKLIFEAGQRFEDLEVLRLVARKPTRWLCRCACGKEVQVVASRLARGRAKSCGCRRFKTIKALGGWNLRHGCSQSRTYSIWCAMRTRCSNPNQPHYLRYGGRGILVCERWESFENFLSDMGEAPHGMSIERMDSDGNYEPSNCKWATPYEQSRNTSQNRLLTYNGETKCMADWAVALGFTYGVLSQRINKLKWSVQRALTTPVAAVSGV